LLGSDPEKVAGLVELSRSLYSPAQPREEELEALYRTKEKPAK
jgi:hypothetical protein